MVLGVGTKAPGTRRVNKLFMIFCHVFVAFQGVPDPLRGQVWQMLVDLEEEPELLTTYNHLTKKVCLILEILTNDLTYESFYMSGFNRILLFMHYHLRVITR